VFCFSLQGTKGTFISVKYNHSELIYLQVFKITIYFISLLFQGSSALPTQGTRARATENRHCRSNQANSGKLLSLTFYLTFYIDVLLQFQQPYFDIFETLSVAM
jgi:hypothetical protein